MQADTLHLPCVSWAVTLHGQCLELSHSPGPCPEELTVWIEFFLVSSFLTLYSVWLYMKENAELLKSKQLTRLQEKVLTSSLGDKIQRPQHLFFSTWNSQIYICKPTSPHGARMGASQLLISLNFKHTQNANLHSSF